MSLVNHHSIRSYEELISLPTFEERLRYLLLYGSVAEDTFGSKRYLNQILYRSPEWRRLRNQIIVRDNSCDLGCDGYEIYKYALIHHINPITIDDILNRNPIVFDPNNLITTILPTHEIIHYGSESDIQMLNLVERSPNDTSPWRL